MSQGNTALDNVAMARIWVEKHAHPSVEGQGGDDALFSAACALVHGFALGAGDAESVLGYYNEIKCSPKWSVSRLQYKIAQAMNTASEHAPGGLARWVAAQEGLGPVRSFARAASGDAGNVAPEPQPVDEWPPFEYSKLVAKEVPGVRITNEWMREHSPMDVTKVDSAGFLRAVFKPSEKVVVFTKFESQGQFGFVVGGKVESWRLGGRVDVKPVPSPLPKGGPDGVWYLCNPVDGEWYPNPRAKLISGEVPLSRRSMESVTDWRHFVLECDHKEKACPCKDCKGRDNPRIHELWLNFIVNLPVPIVAVYTSGGKSVHALIRIGARTKVEWDQYKNVMGKLLKVFGADRGAMSAVRLTRLPGCMRGNKPQELLYLNPEPDLVNVRAIAQGGGI